MSAVQTEAPKVKGSQIVSTGPEPIPVKWIRFIKPIDLPGPKSSADSVTTDLAARDGQPHYRLAYQPWMRHFLIVWDDGRKGVRKVFVHEVHVASWEAML